MCAIIGFDSPTLTEQEIRPYFDRTVSRGPDMSRMEKAGRGMLGFHRLAIMGLHEEGMQPFHLGGDMAVCNGELYGFRPLKKELEAKGYTFASESDCELILPLYREYGVEMFAKLDAEFAMIIYDAKTDRLVAARDPIGIRPLFFLELVRTLALTGLDVLFVPAQWPALRKYHWDTLTAARSIENQMFVVACNSCGKAGETVYGGSSHILDPWGNPIVAAGGSEVILTGDLDFSVIEGIRASINVYRDRRPELYHV